MKKIVYYISFLLPLLCLSNEVPEHLNNLNNWGNDFVFSVPSGIVPNGDANRVKIKLYVVTYADTKINITSPINGYFKEYDLVENTTNEIEIPPTIACPYLKTGTEEPVPDDIYFNKAVSITSDEAVAVYLVAEFGDYSDGMMVIPTSSIGKEYIVTSYNDGTDQNPQYASVPSIITIVGAFNNTEIEFTLGGTEATETAGNLEAGNTTNKILNKGDVWVISTNGSDFDLTGSFVKADKPFSLISSNQCATVPKLNKWCDYLLEMEFPVRIWGRYFHIPVIHNRKYQPVLRIVTKYPDTKIFINGIERYTIPESGGFVNEAYIELRTNKTQGLDYDIVSADKPISINLYNTGVQEDGFPQPEGGPFQVALSPIENYNDENIFGIAGNQNGLAFDDTFVTVVYQTGSGLPQMSFYLNGNKFSYKLDQYEVVNTGEYMIPVAGKDYQQMTVKLRNSGAYWIEHNSDFGVYVYGFKSGRSYGYNGGLNFNDIESEDILPPIFTYQEKCGGVFEGTLTDLPTEDAERANLTNPIFIGKESENFDFRVIDNIIPGNTSTANWELKVRDPSKDAFATIAFRDFANNDTTGFIEYISPRLDLEPMEYNYGSFKLETTGLENNSREFTLENNSVKEIEIKSIFLMKGNVGFTINDTTSYPVTLQDNEIINFSIDFVPLETGVAWDSVIVKTECTDLRLSYVEALVAAPAIEVTDASFGDVTINKTVEETCSILNTGRTELLITGHTNLNEDVFELLIDEINENNPLRLQPDEEYTFSIRFNPLEEEQYIDSIVFSSDAAVYDSICYITSRGRKPGLVAGSFNWGRKRVHRTDYPSGPFPIENGNNAIELTNTGVDLVEINGIDILSEINGDAFEFNRNQFNNMDLAPDQSRSFSVSFRPLQYGPQKIEIAYLDNQNSNAVTVLNGVGVIPKVQTKDFNLDTTEVDNYSSPNSEIIEFRNLDYDEWEYADTLHIFDISIIEDNTISPIPNQYGTEGFSFDKSIIDFPITLAPGEVFSFNMDFVANRPGRHSAKLSIISDALQQDTCELTGYGTVRELLAEGTKIETCLSEEGIGTVLVQNMGINEIEIGQLRFDEFNPNFRLFDPELANGFLIGAGETKEIDVVFRPTQLGEQSVNLIIADKNNEGYEKTAIIEGVAYQYESMAGFTDFKNQATIGELHTVQIGIPEINENDIIKELLVEIDYNEDILRLTENNVSLSDRLIGNFIIGDFTSSNKIKIILSPTNPNAEISTGDLININLEVFLPTGDELISPLEVNLSDPNTACTYFETIIEEIRLDENCIVDLRRVNFSNYNYEFNSISPNPVTKNELEINYQLGINAFTELYLMNSMGEEIRQIKKEPTKAGSYSNKLDISQLSNGVYFIKLNSGPYYKVRKFIINR